MGIGIPYDLSHGWYSGLEMCPISPRKVIRSMTFLKLNTSFELTSQQVLDLGGSVPWGSDAKPPIISFLLFLR